MKLEDFLTPEALEISVCLERTRDMIRKCNRALGDLRFIDFDKEKRKDLLATRNRLCEAEPRLIQLLLEHA